MFSNRIRIAGILLIIAHCSQSFVLLTANIEDVKKIARKFVSDPMAQQIADFIAKAAGQQKEVSNFNPQAENLSAENEKNVDKVDNTSDNDDLNKVPRQATSRRYRKQSRPTIAREARETFENVQRVKPDFRDQSRSYNTPTEATDIREQRTYYEREASTLRQREQRGFDSTPREIDRNRDREERERVQTVQERNRERERDYRSPKKQVQKPKQRESMVSGKDDQYLPLPDSKPKSILQDEQFQEHQRLKEQLSSPQTQVRDAASLTGPKDPMKAKRPQKQNMANQQRAPLKRRPKYQDNQEKRYKNPQSYKPQYKQQYQNQRPNVDQQYDQRQYRNKNQQFNQNIQHREQNKPPNDNLPNREYKLRESEQNQVYNDPELKYKEYLDPKVDEDAERLTRGTYPVEGQTRDYKTKRLRQQDNAFEATEASKYLREGDKKNYQPEDRVPMEADQIALKDVQKEERERLSEPREVNRDVEHRYIDKGMNADNKPAYDQVEYEQTAKRHRTHGRNRERFAFQDNDETVDETEEPKILQEQSNPRVPIAIPPAFNIAPGELTTAKLKNEFDQYDNIKAQPLVATSGPVGLKAADNWWPKESPVVRTHVDEPKTIDVQVAPVPINQPDTNSTPDADPWTNDDPAPKEDVSTMVINLVANIGEEGTTLSPASMAFATGFGNLGRNPDDGLTTNAKTVNILSTSIESRRTTHQMRDLEETVIIDDNIFQYIQS